MLSHGFSDAEIGAAMRVEGSGGLDLGKAKGTAAEDAEEEDGRVPARCSGWVGGVHTDDEGLDAGERNGALKV